MTSEVHVTISAAQQGGMHPFVHLASPFFTRAKKMETRTDRGSERKEKCYLLQSLELSSLKTHYHVERD